MQINNNIFYTETKPCYLPDSEDMVPGSNDTTEVEKARKVERSAFQTIAVVFLTVVSLGAYRLIQNMRLQRVFTLSKDAHADFAKAVSLIQWGASSTPSANCLLQLAENKKIKELTFLFGQIDLPQEDVKQDSYFCCLPYAWQEAIDAGVVRDSVFDNDLNKKNWNKPNEAWDHKRLDILEVWVKYTVKTLSLDIYAYSTIASAPEYNYPNAVFRSALLKQDQQVAEIFEKCGLSLVPCFSANDNLSGSLHDGYFKDKSNEFWKKNIKWLSPIFDNTTDENIEKVCNIPLLGKIIGEYDDKLPNIGKFSKSIPDMGNRWTQKVDDFFRNLYQVISSKKKAATPIITSDSTKIFKEPVIADEPIGADESLD